MQRSYTVNIPEEFYGKEVIVEVKDNEIQTTDSSRLNKLKKIRSAFEGHRVDLSNNKFDREEANNYDE